MNSSLWYPFSMISTAVQVGANEDGGGGDCDDDDDGGGGGDGWW